MVVTRKIFRLFFRLNSRLKLKVKFYDTIFKLKDFKLKDFNDLF